MTQARRETGSDVRESVRLWETGVACYYTRRPGPVFTLGGVGLPTASKGVDHAFFSRGAFELVAGSGDSMRVWGEWVLKVAGLPARKDRGARTMPRSRALMKYRFTADRAGSEAPVIAFDCRENRLMRVMERFETYSAESWAARIEWRFLTEHASGEREVERLHAYLTGKHVEAELGDDARLGRRFKGRRGKPGRVSNMVVGWRDLLPKTSDGERRSNTASAKWIQENCPEAQDLGLDTIRKYLSEKKS